MKTPLPPLWLPVLVGAVVMFMSSVVMAQDDLDAKREQARPLALAGLELLNAGKNTEAIVKLEEAERIFHAPTHLLFIGRARRGQGELIGAYDTFVDILLEDIPNYAPKPFLKAKREAREEADALLTEIATVVIRVSGVPLDRLAVTIDGTPVRTERLAYPIGVTAGAHTIEATAEGTTPASQSIEVSAGQSPTVTLTLSAVATDLPTKGGQRAPESPFPVLATIMLVLGGGALAAGAVTGALTLSKASDIKATCTGTVCPEDQQKDADDAKLLGTVSTAMFIGGGVLAATGIVLMIVDPFGDSASDAESASASLAVRLGPTHAAVIGTF